MEIPLVPCEGRQSWQGAFSGFSVSVGGVQDLFAGFSRKVSRFPRGFRIRYGGSPKSGVPCWGCPE